MFLFCLVFAMSVRVCLYVLCGHLLGKGLRANALFSIIFSKLLKTSPKIFFIFLKMGGSKNSLWIKGLSI